jgi:hypothetical protein
MVADGSGRWRTAAAMAANNRGGEIINMVTRQNSNSYILHPFVVLLCRKSHNLLATC